MSTRPFVPFANTIKIEGVFLYANQYCENVHYFRTDETPDVDLAEELAAAYVEWWDLYLKQQVSASVGLMKVKATIMENQNDPGIEYTTGLPLIGTNGTGSLPNNVTLAIKWATSLRGRSYQGRTYHIGLKSDQVSLNAVTSQFRTNMGIAYGHLLGLETSVGPCALVIASRISGGVERAIGVTTPVTSVYVDETVDSQRRRLPGRGT